MPEEVKEEAKRGGTDAAAHRPIEDPGQSITIHATPDGHRGIIVSKTPSLAQEFL